jgi:copper chaperone NosL
MKRMTLIGFLVFALAGMIPAYADEDIAKHPECPYCGMDRAKFARTRMLFTYEDKGAEIGFCSIHCAAVDLALVLDRVPTYYGVGDYNTKKLIDAEKAFWVIGGDQIGVMTKRAKWAFENKSDAEQFIGAHGGQLATFEESLEAAYADMYKDNQMIREKRKMMREKMKKKE